MKKLLGILAVSAIGVAAWFADVEKQDIPHVNVLGGVNPGFENSTSKWTKTGSSTLAATTANVAYGVSAGEWDASATGEFLRSADVAVPKGLEGRACLMEFEYWLTGGSAGDVVVRMETDGGDALTQDLTLAVNGSYQKAQMGFICPSSDSIRIEFESTANASVLRVDQAYVGRDHRKGDRSQPSEVMAFIQYDKGGGCSYSNAAFGISALNDSGTCSDATVLESSPKATINTTNNGEPDVVFDYLPPGKYEVTAQFTAYGTVASRYYYMGLSNGSLLRARSQFLDVGGNQIIQRNLTAVFPHAGGPVTYAIHGGRLTVGSTFRIENDDNEESIWITVKRFPDETDDVVTLETQGWYVDANIGGANMSLGTGNISTYTAPDIGTIDLVKNTGSADVGISCSGSNENNVGDLTCSAGNEQYGIVFDAPYAGLYKACVSFTHFMQATGGEGQVVFQLIETANNSQTITQEGGSRIHSGFKSQDDFHWPIELCGVFTFTSAGKKTIRLAREQNLSTVSSNQIRSDRSAAVGQRDTHFVVYPLTQNFPQAVAVLGQAVEVGATSNCSDPGITNVCSGTYSPTPTNLSNIDSFSAFDCQWMRVGDVVTVSCGGTMNMTAQGRIDFQTPLPIATDLTSSNHLAGGGICSTTRLGSGAGAAAGGVFANTGNDTASFAGYSHATANEDCFWSYTYRL